jgi:hypothetical protein
LRRFGAGEKKVRRYEGIKEDVYLADFKSDPNFVETLRPFGIEPGEVLVVARTPANFALYHRLKSELFDELLDYLGALHNVKIILLARTEEQLKKHFDRHASNNILAPRVTFDGANLIAAADLVISGGGTMNREAAALGVPVATTFAGKWAAVDEYLVGEGRLTRIRTSGDFALLRIEKKGALRERKFSNVKSEVAGLILDPM